MYYYYKCYRRNHFASHFYSSLYLALYLHYRSQFIHYSCHKKIFRIKSSSMLDFCILQFSYFSKKLLIWHLGVCLSRRGASGPFFSHIGNAIFCPLFHRRIFSFFISTGEICFCLFVVAIPARVYLNMRFFIQISTQYSLFSQKFPLKLDFMYSRSKTILC